jgi:ABC-type dipeptide/oligopeptide/nickel transport system permease component
MAILTVSAGMVIGANFMADLLYGYLDPRIRRA